MAPAVKCATSCTGSGSLLDRAGRRGAGLATTDIEPDDAVLFIHRANTCLPDGGIPDAAIDGGFPDAGSISTDAPITPVDTGVPPPETFRPRGCADRRRNARRQRHPR